MAQRDKHKKISNLLGSQGSRLDINIDDLRGFNPDLARYVTQNPIEAISMFEVQLDCSDQDSAAAAYPQKIGQQENSNKTMNKASI